MHTITVFTGYDPIGKTGQWDRRKNKLLKFLDHVLLEYTTGKWAGST